VFRLTVSKEDHPVINVAEIPEQKLQDDTEALWD
jgi:hypothetical protein